MYQDVSIAAQCDDCDLWRGAPPHDALRRLWRSVLIGQQGQGRGGGGGGAAGPVASPCDDR